MAEEKLNQKISSIIKEHLLQSEAAKYILKIILFGSWAKGLFHTNSDIDVLIVKKLGEDADKYINNAVYDTILNTGLPIEVLICSVEDILWPDSYFIYNILSYGKELYSMDKEALKKEAMRGLLELSREYLISAEYVAKGKYWRLAVDAAYNSLELAAKALLLEYLDDLPSSHGAVVAKFGELFVKTKQLNASIGRGLHKALQLRNQARYKWETKMNKEDYKQIYTLAKNLHQFADKKI